MSAEFSAPLSEEKSPPMALANLDFDSADLAKPYDRAGEAVEA
jgi:hypothetical protein